MKNLMFTKLIVGLIIIINKVLCDKDLYKVMGLPRNASQTEIKRKYRELTRKYHPDKNNGSKEASAKFSEVAEAYEVLSDTQKRRRYDRGGMEAVNQNEQQGQNFDPFDVFGMFGGGGARRENRDADVRIKIRASLKDLYLGKEFEVKIVKLKFKVYLYQKYYLPALQRKRR
jgi:DnaJ-related protein SCJ1